MGNNIIEGLKRVVDNKTRAATTAVAITGGVIGAHADVNPAFAQATGTRTPITEIGCPRVDDLRPIVKHVYKFDADRNHHFVAQGDNTVQFPHDPMGEMSLEDTNGKTGVILDSAHTMLLHNDFPGTDHAKAPDGEPLSASDVKTCLAPGAAKSYADDMTTLMFLYGCDNGCDRVDRVKIDDQKRMSDTWISKTDWFKTHSKPNQGKPAPTATATSSSTTLKEIVFHPNQTVDVQKGMLCNGDDDIIVNGRQIKVVDSNPNTGALLKITTDGVKVINPYVKDPNANLYCEPDSLAMERKLIEQQEHDNPNITRVDVLSEGTNHQDIQGQTNN